MHLECDNYTEAAHTLMLYAKLLEVRMTCTNSNDCNWLTMAKLSLKLYMYKLILTKCSECDDEAFFLKQKGCITYVT